MSSTTPKIKIHNCGICTKRHIISELGELLPPFLETTSSSIHFKIHNSGDVILWTIICYYSAVKGHFGSCSSKGYQSQPDPYMYGLNFAPKVLLKDWSPKSMSQFLTKKLMNSGAPNQKPQHQSWISFAFIKSLCNSQQPKNGSIVKLF